MSAVNVWYCFVRLFIACIFFLLFNFSIVQLHRFRAISFGKGRKKYIQVRAYFDSSLDQDKEILVVTHNFN